MLHFYFVLICFALEINYLNYGHLNVLFLHYGSLRIIFTFKPMCTVKPLSFNCRRECVKQCFELARWNFLGETLRQGDFLSSTLSEQARETAGR